MYTLLVLTALAQPAPGGSQPVQVVARIDARGNLTITAVTDLGSGGGYGSAPVAVAPEKAPVKVKITRVVVTTAELPAKHVEAYTTDGKAIAAEKLAELLTKERTVLLALDGKKIDPFHLQLYKEGTIILVPPANTLSVGPSGLSSQPDVSSPPRSSPPDRNVPPPDRKPDQPKQ